nr:hypothetical protein [Tanacetum cinerariifolium]GEX05708.1 hypothetical protein [Tanacetum cinerariifolium]
MAETMEQYMIKPQTDYGSGVARPKIKEKYSFELKGQFLKELRENTFSGSDNKDPNEHIEKVLEIVDYFINKLTGSIKTWKDLKTKFLNKYCPPGQTTKKIEEINNFQQEPDESLYQAWKCFKELLMKCPQHYLNEMQEAIQEMANYSQKRHNRTSRGRSTKTFDELAAIQAQLNNLGRDVKKANEKVYAAQVGCKQCKGPHYTKYSPLKEEGKTLEEAYYTQFGGPFQDTLSKFMGESAKRHEENSNLIKEIRALTDATIRNQGALIKTFEIQNRANEQGASVSVMPLLTYLNLGLGELAHTRLTVELADRTTSFVYPRAKIGRPFLSIALAKIDVYKRKITLRVREENIIFKSVKPTSNLIKRVYMLSLIERIKLDLEARPMGETLVINRSLDPLNGDYIKLNDLNEPFKLWINQDNMVYKGDNVVGALMNVPIFVETFFIVTNFAVLKDMDAYRDEGMGDVIVGEPFLREVGIKARRFDGMITIYNGDDEVAYQMVRSHPRFKHNTNEQCNKFPPLLKDPTLSEFCQWKNGSHAGTLACMRWNESVSTQMVAVAKLLVLNPNEFKLWTMKIEQYFLMTDYALWEVILNGDSPPPTRSIDDVEKAYPPITIDEKLARKNELKARGTLLIDLPNEHQPKFNSYKSVKSLMEAIEKRFRGNKESKKVQKILLKLQYENFNETSSEGLHQIYNRLQKLINLENLRMDDLYKNLKIYETKIMGSSSTTQNTQNVAFVSSNNIDNTNKAVNTTHGVSAASSKIDASNLPNVDSLSYFARECRALKHQDNRNKEAPRRTVPAEDGPTNFALMSYPSLSSSISDFAVSSCSKACLKPYETLKEHYDNLTKDFNKSQLNLGVYKVGLESVEARLKVYKKNKTVFEEDIKILKLDVMFRDKAITKRYDSQGFDSQVLENQVNDKYNTGEGYHVVPPPYTRNFMPHKHDLVFADEHIVSESVTILPGITKSKVKTSESKLRTVSEPIIKDWVSDSEDKNKIETETKKIKPSFLRAVVSVNTARPINTAYSRSTMNGARPESNVFNKAHSHVRISFNKFTTNKNNTFNQKVNTVKGNVTTFGSKAVVCNKKGNEGNPQQELQEKGVIDSRCFRHKTRNMSYLSEYKEIDDGYAAFGGDPKGGKITVFLRVPRKNNMYSVDLKNAAPSEGLTCLFAKATLDESNLWHRKLGHINFKTMNKLVRGNLVRGLPQRFLKIIIHVLLVRKESNIKPLARLKL